MIKKNSFIQLIDGLKSCMFNKKTLVVVFSFWVVFQFIWTWYFQYDEWVSDSGLYQYYAKSCYEAGTLYPNMQFYHYEYIHNPGWVNILIAWYALFGSFSGVPYFLILINLLCFILLWKTSMEVANSTVVPYIVAYIYMCLPAFSTTFTFFWSEPSYIFFILLSVFFTLKRQLWFIVLAGICLALAYWIRPVAIASAAATIIFIVTLYKKRKYIVAYLLGAVGGCLCIAYATHRDFPNYLCTATTGGVNLIMVAHDNATGRWDGSVRQKGGSGYIPGLWSEKNRPVYTYFNSKELLKDYTDKYNYEEVNRIYMDRSIKWIKENPLKYLSLIPQKLMILFDGSATMWSPNYKGHHYLRIQIVKYQQNIVKLLVFLLLIGLLFPFWRNKKHLYIVLNVFFYVVVTLISVVDPRFNWAFMPFIILFVSLTIERLYIQMFHFLARRR